MISASAVCPLCSGTAALRWPEVSIWKCGSCALIFRCPVPTEAQLAVMYETSWLEPDVNRQQTGATSLEFARTYCAKLAASIGRQSFEGLRILEFGTGRGALLRALVERGAEVCAIEPFGYESVKSQGFVVYRTLQELPDGSQFDGIVTIDVVEHLLEPWHELRQLHNLLRDHGWLFVATPNTQGINATLRRGRWREAMNPGHMILFTPSSMEMILSSSGFGSWQRLKWQVIYRRDFPRRMLHIVLQAISLDGELRYLARR